MAWIAVGAAIENMARTAEFQRMVVPDGKRRKPASPFSSSSSRQLRVPAPLNRSFGPASRTGERYEGGDIPAARSAATEDGDRPRLTAVTAHLDYGSRTACSS